MTRLLLTEGNAATRDALRYGLAAAQGLEVATEAATGHDLLALVAGASPTVVLFDLHLGPDAFALLSALREQNPQLRILAHAELTNEHYVVRAFDLGAHGYVLKSARATELVHGLHTVAAGRPFLCSAIGLALLKRLHAGSAAANNDAARAALGLPLHLEAS